MVESANKNGGPNNLEAWRKHRKMSQERLADLVGTSANMIGYLESGDRALSLKWLRRLGEALNITPGQLADTLPSEEAIEAELHSIMRRQLDQTQRRTLLQVARGLAERDEEAG